MSQSGGIGKALKTETTAEGRSKSWGSLRRPSAAAPTKKGQTAPAFVPAPSPAAQVVQRVPLPRMYPPNFDLQRSVGPKRRDSYSTPTKLNVINYTRLRYPDGGVVGNRETAAGLGRGLCPKRVLPVHSFKWLGDDCFQRQKVLKIVGDLWLVVCLRLIMSVLLLRNTCTSSTCP